jgi:hypothetical protein
MLTGKRYSVTTLPCGKGGTVKAIELTEAQAWAVGELRLYIDNEETLYGQRRSIIKNLLRKVDRGTYDHARAPKLWRYLVDRGARDYSRARWGRGAGAGEPISRHVYARRHSFPALIRNAVAQGYADEFRDDVDAARDEVA